MEDMTMEMTMTNEAMEMESEDMMVAADDSGIGKVLGVAAGVVVGGIAAYKFVVKPAIKKAKPVAKKVASKMPWNKKKAEVEVELVEEADYEEAED